VPVWHTVSYCPTSSLVTLALVSAWPSATFLAVIGHRTCMFISYPTLCCWLLYIQWRQCECNFGRDEECIKEQLQGIRESPVFIRRQRWIIGSVVSPCEVCANTAELDLNENSREKTTIVVTGYGFFPVLVCVNGSTAPCSCRQGG